MFKLKLNMPLWYCLMTILVFSGIANAEKIVMSTDRDVYIAGDRLYLSLQLQSTTGKASDYVYIALSATAGNRIFTGCMKLTNDKSFGSIYLPDTLSTGMYRLISYSNCMRNSGGMFYAFRDLLVVNRFDNDFSGYVFNHTRENFNIPALTNTGSEQSGRIISTDKMKYNPREKMIVQLTIPGTGKLEPLSLSVRQVAPVCFVPDSSDHVQNLINNSCTYLQERSGIVLQGNLRNIDRTPVPQQPVFLSCVDSVANLQHTLTDSGGLFRFFLNPWYFGKTLMIKSENGYKGTITVDEKLLPDYSFATPALNLTGDLTGFIRQSQKYLTVQKAYAHDFHKDSENTEAGHAYRPAVFETTPSTVKPADFVDLSDFVEISREILPYLKIRERKDDYKASVLDLDQNFFSDTYIFVDGVLIEDVDQIISFDSRSIRKIETLPNTRFIGELKIPSVLSIFTSRQRIKELKWKYPVVSLHATDIMHLSEYIVPNPDVNSRQTPDFRQLLCWMPVVDYNNQTGSFEMYTSDCTGSFEAVLTCTGKDGKVREFKTFFKVERP